MSWASIVLIPEYCHVIKSALGPEGEDLPWVYDPCARTIETDHTLTIAHAAASPEFSTDASAGVATNKPRMRFYAGHPIRTACGSRIGALCLIDDRPRSFNQADERELLIRAAQVGIEIRVGTPDS